MKKINWMKENAVFLLVTAAVIGVVGCIVYAAYAHRVIEFKCYPVTAVITGTYYEPGHYETVKKHDREGGAYYDSEWKSAVYGLYYDVDFEGSTYCEYAVVSEGRYRSSHTGDSVSATFRKEWRADSSETYSIHLN